MLHDGMIIHFLQDLMFDVLVIVSKGVGGNLAETKLVTELVRTLEFFVQCSDSDLRHLVQTESKGMLVA
jgi:hypothetical protein